MAGENKDDSVQDDQQKCDELVQHLYWCKILTATQNSAMEECDL
jgi:hypothetical protein